MSMATRGRSKEYRVRDFFKEKGFHVVRSAGSKGTADLIAIRGFTYLINVKTDSFAPPKEREALVKLYKRLKSYDNVGVRVVLANCVRNSKQILFRRYTCLEQKWVDIKPEKFW